MGRTYMGEETLGKELKGYGEYAKKGGYRLIPGFGGVMALRRTRILT